MSWTYDGTPNLVTRDAVRVLAGQTSSGDDVLILDEEIDFALTEANNNKYGASAVVCEMLASRYALAPDTETVGTLGLSWNDRSAKFAKRAIELRAKILLVSGVSPYSGGQTKSDLLTDQSDRDAVQPHFRAGMDNNPAAAWSDDRSTVRLP